MSSRITFSLICLLILLALASTAFAAWITVQAFQNLERQNALARAGDVDTIHPWMTIPYIAHTYHVPESYLYQALHLSDSQPPRHIPLQALATRYHRPVGGFIHTLQTAILTYRKEHPRPHLAFPSRSTRQSVRERTAY